MEDIGFIILMFVIAIGSFGMLIYTSIKKYEGKRKKNNELKEKGSNYNSIFSTEVNHISGLPLAENSKCIMHLCDNQIVIESTNNIYKLSKNNILDMNIKTSQKVENSISGAIAGYMTLGLGGAALGGSTTEIHRFFMIIYKNKENIRQNLSFKINSDIKTYQPIYNYIEKFKNNLENKTEIEL